MNDRRISALAAAFQRGDERSFEALVDALSRSLIATAYRYARDWEWARDLTQETWIKVYERIHSYDPSKSFQAWLFAVHRNACLDHVRRAWVRLESPTPAGSAVFRRPAAGADPHEQTERREFHDQLLRALGELSESQRQVFVRVDIEQGAPQQVAEAMGIKYATLRATLHFARKRLAKILRDREEEL